MATQVMEAVFKASGVSQFQKAFSQAEAATKKLNNVGKNMRDIGATMTKRVTAPIIGVATAVAVTGAKFDDQMQTVAAVTRATGDELDNLRELAKDMGKSTRFSASEAAEGMEMLARAGFETDEIMVAIPEVLSLAAAGAVDLGDAADITSNILSGFKMEADETGRIVDILAQASADSNVDVESLGEAMKYVAPVASDLGISIEDTTAAIGFLGDAGIQGGQAGRQLRKGIQSLAAPTDQAAGLMNELGIEVFDANGKMKDLPSIIGELEGGLDGMSDAQKTAALQTLFGSDAMSAWSILIGEGSEELGLFSNELANSEGTAAEMADTMEDSVAGAFREMKSAIEGLSIEFYEMGEGPLRDLIEWVTDLINKFTESSDETKQWIIIIAGIAAAVGPVVWIIGVLTQGISLLVGVFSFLFSPVGLVIAIFVALVAVGVLVYKNWETISEKAHEIWGAIAEWFTEVWTSIKESATEIWDGVKQYFTDTWESISNTISEVWGSIKEYFSETWESIKETAEIAWDTVVNVLTVGWMLIEELFALGIDIIMLPWNFIWENFGEPMTEAWEAIKLYLSETLELISNWINEKWMAIKEFTAETWGIIKESIIQPIAEVWELVKEKASEMLAGLTEKWNSIKETTSNVWNAIKTVLSSVWEGIKALVSTAVTAVSTKVSSVWNTIKSVTSTIWNSIKSTISSVWEGIKSGVSNSVNSVKTSVSSAWDSVKTKTSEVWSSLKEAITTPINSAKDTVKGAIDKMKGFMDFSWSLPKLKMPHFTKSGKFSLNPPSVPKFGVEWYKDGGIMSSATAFGMNGNNVMIGGEAGREAILPLNRSVLGDIGRGIVDSTNMGSSKNITINQYITSPNALNEREMQRRSRLELQKLGVDFAY